MIVWTEGIQMSSHLALFSLERTDFKFKLGLPLFHTRLPCPLILCTYKWGYKFWGRVGSPGKPWCWWNEISDSCVLPVSGSMMTTESQKQDDDIKIMLNRITLRPNQGARVTSSTLALWGPLAGLFWAALMPLCSFPSVGTWTILVQVCWQTLPAN